MSTRLHIRDAVFEDLETLTGFSAAMAVETEGRHLDRDRLRAGTQALLDSAARGRFVVAEARSETARRVVGQLMLTYEWSDWRNGCFWWIQSVYIDPPFRRQGIYRQLYQHIVGQASSDASVCGVRLYVAQENHIAQEVYRRVGLVPAAYRVYEQDFVFPQTSETTSQEVP